MKVQLLADNRDSWIIPYAHKLNDVLLKEGWESRIIYDHADVEQGDVLCLLSCEKIFKRLDLNAYNLVVHESDLPKGKGWSPLTWQILEGKNEIPITLFEAEASVDSGIIYDKKYITYNGSELLDELKDKQGE